jgi:hypothetical protein
LITRRCGDGDALAVQRDGRHGRIAGCALLDGLDRALAPTVGGGRKQAALTGTAFVAPAGAPDCSEAVFADLSKFDHVPTHVRGHSRMMASESEPLTTEEFVSLLTVGNTCAVREPPAVIPAEHSARLIELGYIADLAGRLRMTTSGRSRMAAGFENRPLPIEIWATRRRNRPAPNGP